MRRRYRFNEKTMKMEEVDADYKAPGRGAGMQIITDIDQQGRSYHSPVDNAYITSRRARRENLLRHNCREVDPSEKDHKPQDRTNWDFLDKI